jgi:hypothetical protein
LATNQKYRRRTQPLLTLTLRRHQIALLPLFECCKNAQKQSVWIIFENNYPISKHAITGLLMNENNPRPKSFKTFCREVNNVEKIVGP